RCRAAPLATAAAKASVDMARARRTVESGFMKGSGDDRISFPPTGPDHGIRLRIRLTSGMHKDIGPKPLEPFTREEEKELVERLDALPMASLESYIASARSALGNKGLAPTWRPRIEFGARHAEQALSKAQSVAASE